MIKAKKMKMNVIQKCLEVVRKCASVVKQDPLGSGILASLGVISSIGTISLVNYFVLFIANAVDVWTGWVEARRNPEIDENSDGLKQKSADLLVMYGVITIPTVLSFAYPSIFPLAWGFTFFFLWVEGKSIVENMKGANFRVTYLEKFLNIFENFLHKTLERISKKKQDE